MLIARRPSFLATVLLIACRSQTLSPSTHAIRFEPKVVDFGSVFVDGQPHERSLSVVNDGRFTLTALEWNGLSDPFTAEFPSSLPSGESVIAVRFIPKVTGKISQVVFISGSDALLTVTANGIAIPTCTPTVACAQAHFDLIAGQCVETPVPNGAPCDPQSVCIANGQCLEGRCIGQERTCDDGNACTIDVCNGTTGCEFLPRPPCPGDGQCLLGACDPITGCGMEPADDGTTCGSLQTCQAAQICVTGQCVIRAPPEGYLCAEASPCQGEGRCVNDACVRASVQTPLVDHWYYDTLRQGDDDAGIEGKQLHDFMIEPSGAMTLSGFFHTPSRLRANTPEALDLPHGTSRRCIVWGERLICADYPSSPNGRVTAVNLATGVTEWSFDVRTARPDFVEQTAQIFLARLVVQASDRLAAIFEAYPKNPTSSLCRSYFLIVMNAQGRLITASPLVDPLLTACNHPHPYGAVSDAVGNLFLAFSPTISIQAPLKPAKPTLLVSYTRDGLFRWKVTDPDMEGGELAVARGLLYPENGEVVRTAATGAPAFAVPQKLGRIVVGDSRFIAAPREGQSVLRGYEAGQPNLSWAHELPSGLQFGSDQLRLASWRTSHGTETIALTFVRDSFEVSLRGIRVHDGSEAFTCPLTVPLRTSPQLFEIANGSMGVMEGALDLAMKPGCNQCDPPFAGSAAAFHHVKLPGISVPHAPWVGTFGGAGHDHREEVDPLIPGNASN